MAAKSVIVVGGGLGGISAAIRLAASGFRVELFEKNDQLGGKMGELRDCGYRFDTGPSLLTMPFIIDELFAAAGARREDVLAFERIEPICRYFFADGHHLDASHEPAKMQQAIAALAAGDARNYGAFLDYSRRIYELTADLFLFTPFQEWRHLLRWRHLDRLWRLGEIDALRTVDRGIRRFFRDPRIVQLFDRYATYNGSNPFQAPATLNIIPHVEYTLGSFYIAGGMYRLVDALQQLALDLGVRIHAGVPVQAIRHDGRRILGVRAGGDFVHADYVVCNQDVVVAFNQLIDGFPAVRRRLNRLEPSSSGLVFMWGVQKSHPALAHHNIFFSHDYRREFQQIFTDQQTPADPTIYAAITSKHNPAHAPSGSENWFVLINMPYLSPALQWHDTVSRVREVVLQRLRDRGFDLAPHIEVEHTITPPDFASRFASNRGSIYGISSNSKRTAFRRPANRSRLLRGLYFAGGSAHPGGGIPLVLLSGKMAADLITEDAGARQQGRPANMVGLEAER